MATDDVTVLQFTNTIDDIIAFNRYQFATSPEARRIQRKQTVVLMVAFAAFAASLFAYTRSLFLAAAVGIAGMAGPLLSATLLKPSIARRIDRRMRRALSEGKNEGILGPRRLSLLDDWLEEESATTRSGVRYQTLGRVEETPEYVFIYLSSQHAVVIPKRDVEPPRLEAFLRALRAKLQVIR